MTFSQLYGTKLDRELGSSDRTQRFSTALRKEYVNEGQRVFNEHTSCFVKRASIALVDSQAEYDVESTGVITAGDYLWPSKTTASLKRYDGSGTDPSDYSYIEGDGLPFKAEEELNHTRPNWRAESPGTPECWTMRDDGGSQYVVLVPPPDVPAAETWTLLWPYVALPPDMSADGDQPYSVSSNPRTTLIPYHEGILYYATAQCEKLRKDVEREDRAMKKFAGVVLKFQADSQPKRGSQIRLAVNYRARLRMPRPPDPLRFP